MEAFAQLGNGKATLDLYPDYAVLTAGGTRKRLDYMEKVDSYYTYIIVREEMDKDVVDILLAQEDYEYKTYLC